MATTHLEIGKKTFKENRLANEKSPYLLQHKNNPVEWFPWGEEALTKAKSEDKPIFLSVGYSTCHWCHVMAHESFENEEIAKLMNENFVNIKLDREERPDIDKVYMTFVQATQGGGGWPMSVFLTPELKPILAATYFPPKDQYGRKGFPSVCEMVFQSWHNNKDGILAQSRKMTSLVVESIEQSSEEQFDFPEKKSLDKCFQQISRGYDTKEGGFGRAPKFPRPVLFDFLFRYSESKKQSWTMCDFTLKKMCNGGMYDHVGGGFHRYSVTNDWHIPHYEKMLYDQAQLTVSLIEAYQISKDEFFRIKATETADYVLSKLTSPLGGFYCAEDADSFPTFDSKQSQEGAFYIWTAQELKELLGDDFEMFAHHFEVKEKGNAPPEGDPHGELDGKNTLIARKPLEATATKFSVSISQAEQVIQKCLKILYEQREKRPRPHLDDKIVVSWNGLMISALAKCYAALQDDKYLKAAQKAVSFIQEKLYNPEKGTLIRNYRDGPSKIDAFTDDYSFLVQGLLDLYEVTLDGAILKWAVELHKKQVELFLDTKGGGFFICGTSDPSILLRMKEDYDGSEPSNNSVSAISLLRFHNMFQDEKAKILAGELFKHFSGFLSNSPIALPKMCVALDWYYAEKSVQLVFIGNMKDKVMGDMLKCVNQHFLPRTTVIHLSKENFDSVEWTKQLPQPKDSSSGHVVICSKFVGKEIATNAQELEKYFANLFKL